MKQYWARLENWLQKNAAHMLDQVNSGASRNDIEKLEMLIGKKLPEDFVEFYKIHNGQDEEKGREGLINAEQLLPIDKIILQWQFWKELLDNSTFEYDGDVITSEPEEGIKNDWWNAAWVPFTHDGCGNHISIDLDPAPAGNYGQVIHMWHDSQYRKLYASSFTEYISGYITGLENGKTVYAKDWGPVDKDSPFNEP